MKCAVLFILFAVPLPLSAAPPTDQGPPPAKAVPALPNPNIDMAAYVRSINDVAAHRATRRLSEAEFIKMSAEPGVVVLDARSTEKFALLHVDGAVNLSFPDISIGTLAKSLPDKQARILIYCNNNFKNSDRAFPPKAPVASLNIATYVALYNYGYRNVYELAPLVDPATSKLTFAGLLAPK